VIEDALQQTPRHLQSVFWQTYQTGETVPKIDEMVDEWIASLSHLAANTLLERRSAVTKAVKTMSGRGIVSLPDVNRDVAKWYVAELGKSSAASATVNKAIQALNSYWTFLHNEGMAPDALWKGLQRKKQKRVDADELERPFTHDEVLTLLSGGASAKLYDAMVIALLTGARLSEVGRLKVEHVSLAKMTIKIPGTKTLSSSRLIPLHPELTLLLTKRVAEKAPRDFVLDELTDEKSLKHGRGRAAAVSQEFTRYRRKLGVDDKVEGKRRAKTNFHSFRRWTATTLVEAGVAENVVKAIQGWQAQSGSMIGRYTVGADLMVLMREAIGKLALPQARMCVDAKI
jgi:integrase